MFDSIRKKPMGRNFCRGLPIFVRTEFIPLLRGAAKMIFYCVAIGFGYITLVAGFVDVFLLLGVKKGLGTLLHNTLAIYCMNASLLLWAALVIGFLGYALLSHIAALGEKLEQ